MKLTLRREALAALAADDLRAVAAAGAAESVVATCPLGECLVMTGRSCPVTQCVSDLLSCDCPTV